MLFKRKKTKQKSTVERERRESTILPSEFRNILNIEDDHPLLDKGINLSYGDVHLDGITTTDDVILVKRESTIDGKYRVLVDRKQGKREISAAYTVHMFPLHGIPFTILSDDVDCRMSEILCTLNVSAEFHCHTNIYDEIVMQYLLNIAKMLISKSIQELLVATNIMQYEIFNMDKLKKSIQHFDGYVCHVGNRNNNVLIDSANTALSKELTREFMAIDSIGGYTIKIHK